MMGESGFPEPPAWIKGAKDFMEFLQRVPVRLQETTCRCGGREFPGWYYNSDRKMWVCGNCNKPSAAHQGYNIICIWCEEWFTLQEFPAGDDEDIEVRKAAFKTAAQLPCRDCGGDNDARILEESLF